MNSCKTVTPVEAAEFLRQNNDYYLLTHSNPDGDTLGSAYALALMLWHLGKRVTVLCADPVPEKFNYFTNVTPGQPAKGPGCAVAVDVADAKLLGGLAGEYANRVELCIDHHVSNTRYAKRLYLNAEAAANCENIFELAPLLNYSLTVPAAKALYTGLSTDTGCFRYSNTTPRTLRIAADLCELNINHAKINRLMFETKSRARLELEKQALAALQFYYNGKCSVICVTNKMLSSTGCTETDVEGITANSRCIEGVLVGVTVKQKSDLSFKVSLRSYDPVDSSAICKIFGGGGHRYAAGCQFSADHTVEQVRDAVVAAVGKALGE